MREGVGRVDRRQGSPEGWICGRDKIGSGRGGVDDELVLLWAYHVVTECRGQAGGRAGGMVNGRGREMVAVLCCAVLCMCRRLLCGCLQVRGCLAIATCLGHPFRCSARPALS